jgi:hypothetical protein
MFGYSFSHRSIPLGLNWLRLEFPSYLSEKLDPTVMGSESSYRMFSLLVVSCD